ncbi:MAG TPA: peptide MFS transporter [Longimicrobiaceae bacterium]|nr:peptide MFS transporter [Longimicrobiaceae bacterium]
MTKTPTDEFASSSAAALAGSPPLGAGPEGASFFGHPRGLGTLFFTEMWERFSYYGMRALLVLFMTAAVADGGLGFGVAKSAAIYGLYTAFVYVVALPGGWIADNLLGQRRAVLWGGIIIAAGHFSMAVPGLPTFYLGLGLIVAGTGLLKPNVSAMVGELYQGQESARRDAGFSIFYMGINLGAFFAPLVTGFLGEKINWHLGFAAAGVGMVFGVIQYMAGGKYLGEAGLYPEAHEPDVLARKKRGLYAGLAIVAVALVLLFFVFDVGAEEINRAGTALIVGITAVYFLYLFIAGGLTAQEKKQVGAIGVFFLAAAIFWSGFEQAGSSLNLVAEKLTNLHVLGWEAPASWLQSVNPLFIIALAPVFAWLWVYLSNKHLEPSSPVKFAAGLILLGAGFAVMILAAARAESGHLVSPLWLIVTYFLHTTGELTLSPVGLSKVTQLAPKRMVSQMMGIWFLAASLGNLIAGQLAGLIGTGQGAGGEISAAAAQHIFTIVTYMSVGAGVVMLVIAPLVKRWMGAVK